MGMDGMGGDIDWGKYCSTVHVLREDSGTDNDAGAWDSYIQGTGTGAMDATQMWPLNLDLAMDTGGQTQQTDQNGGNNPGGVFMGARTPGSGNMM